MSSLVMAICNQKAGVGKTTTAIRLGCALLERGRKVLLVDLDPEGRLTVACGIDSDELPLTIYNVLCGTTTMAEILRVEILYEATGLDLAPANMDLAAAEFELVGSMYREEILRNALEPLRKGYDYIVIDCPSSLGLLTVNAMVGADVLLIPVECEHRSLRDLRVLLQTYVRVRRYNSRLSILGILPYPNEIWSPHTREVLEELKELYPRWALEPIRKSTRF